MGVSRLPGDWAAEALAAGAPPVITSRHDGTCRACGTRWAPGEQITFDEGEDAWIHLRCADPDR